MGMTHRSPAVRKVPDPRLASVPTPLLPSTQERRVEQQRHKQGLFYGRGGSVQASPCGLEAAATSD